MNKTKRKPFKHQIEACDFLLKKKRAILADEPGAGKTSSAILAMTEITGKKLIVCPASLKLNWKKEIKILNNDEVVIINSGKKWRTPKRKGWVIINYDILKNHSESIKKSKFKAVCFDEAHYCKSIQNNGYAGSKRARSFISVANAIDYCFVLTGTPITNKTKDIYNLLKVIKHPLGTNFKKFANQYCAPTFNGFGYTYDGSSNQEELNEKLKDCMLRRKKEDLLDLPEKIRNFIPTDVNLKEYQQKVDEYMSKRNHLDTKQAHLVYLNAMRHILAKEKAKHTIKLVENLKEQKRPVVVFTNYTAVVDVLRDKFPEAVTIIGKNSEKERQKAVDDFQSGKTDIIICNLIAGGVGVTLTRAKNTIIQDIDWVPANMLQAEDRIHRVGQNEKVIIEYIYSEGTIDEKMANLLEEKMININKIIDDNEEGFVDKIIKNF